MKPRKAMRCQLIDVLFHWKQPEQYGLMGNQVAVAGDALLGCLELVKGISKGDLLFAVLVLI